MRRHLLTLLLILAATVFANGARAQLLPGGLPQLPPLPRADNALGAVGSTVQSTARAARDLRLQGLVQRFPRELERDPRGAPVMRSVILALSPAPQPLQDALARGFTIRSDEDLPVLGERVVTLLAPRGLSTRRALAQLRRRDPAGRYDFSHVYLESAAAAVPGAQPEPRTTQQGAAVVDATAARIGLIDSGLRLDHPALTSGHIEIFGCGGHAVPALHGTAVASLLVGRDVQFRGAAPGARLFAADAWCGDAAPGGGIEAVARSLAWLATCDVSVINLSLVGPPNVVLEGLVRRVQARGIVLVAAAGNDGPSAPPLYPAGYSGVIAVTAVDGRQKALLEAARGRHIRFAAPGADLLAAALTPDYQPVRGTSFAAPLVAGLIASQVAGGATAPAALATLSRQARDLGRKGRDDVYGEGLVGEQFARTAAANK